MPRIAALAPILQTLLTETAERAARESGCVQRVRQFSGVTLIQTLVLGFLEAPDASLSALCQLAAARGVTISPQGLAQRFTPDLTVALEQVLAAVVSQVVRGPRVAIPLLGRFTHVWVLDTTTITLPDALADAWAGCGGNAGQGQAALEIDLVTGQLAGPLRQPGRAPDRTTPLLSRPRAAGSLSIRDLGFFSLDQVETERAAGGHWLSRLMAGTIVCTADGGRWTRADLRPLPWSIGRSTSAPARGSRRSCWPLGCPPTSLATDADGSSERPRRKASRSVPSGWRWPSGPC